MIGVGVGVDVEQAEHPCTPPRLAAGDWELLTESRRGGSSDAQFTAASAMQWSAVEAVERTRGPVVQLGAARMQTGGVVLGAVPWRPRSPYGRPRRAV